MTPEEYYFVIYNGYEMKGKHDKRLKMFDYYDLMDFAQQYHDKQKGCNKCHTDNRF